MRREKDGPATRDAILDAALCMFTENTFAGSSMADVAKRAGVAVGSIYRFFAPLEPVRAAHPLVGPADTVTLSMRPGVEYLIYHNAPESEVGRDRRFGSPGHVAGGIGVGRLARSDVAYRGVARAVTAGGHTFHLAFRADNSISIDVPISCTGGPVLAEEMPAYRGEAVTGRNVAIAVVALSAVGAIAWWLARSRRTRRTDG